MSEDFDVDDAVARATGSGHRDDSALEESPTDADQGQPAAPDRPDAPTDDGTSPGTASNVKEWLLEPASKSHREVDAGDFFDVVNGGRNRLALVASDYLGSKYPPRIYQLAVGIIEEAIGFTDGLDVEEGAPDAPDRDQDDVDDDTAVPLTEVEAA